MKIILGSERMSRLAAAKAELADVCAVTQGMREALHTAYIAEQAARDRVRQAWDEIEAATTR